MTKTTGVLTGLPVRLLEFEYDVVHRADVKHPAADALPPVRTGTGDTKTLEDEIPVMLIFKQGQALNENSGSDSEKDN